MKKTRIFLGVTAFTLAIASAVAAKARQVTVTYYYTTGAVANQCITQPLAAETSCQIGGTGCLFTVGDVKYQLYTSKSIAGACQNSLEVIP